MREPNVFSGMKHLLQDAALEISSVEKARKESDEFVTVQPKKRADLRLIEEHLQDPIKLSYVRELILWILSDGINQRWAFVKNRHSISKICMVVSQDSSFPLPSSSNGIIRASPKLNCYDFGVKTLCGVEKFKIIPPEESLLYCNASKANRSGSAAEVLNSFDQLILDEYCLTENNFPVKLPEGFILTNETIPIVHSILAIDCEMVQTSEGSSLARISVVDQKLTVIYDKLVKPSLSITDYLTQYNGITEELLANVDTNLQDVQKDLLALIHSDTIIVGHSVENDLACLKIFHQKIIDTSILFKHPKYPTYKHSLKYITKKYLHKDIQFGAHDSIEDARACMELVCKKMERGINFGVEQPKETLSERLALNGKTMFVTSDESDFLANLPKSDLTIFTSPKPLDSSSLESLINERIVPALPKYSLILFVNGCKSSDRLEEFFSRKLLAHKNKDSSWTDGDEFALQHMIQEAREGFCLFKLLH